MKAIDVINRTTELLIAQGKGSRAEVLSIVTETHGLACAYRAEGGFKCAAGMWISDADYNVRMEGRSASHVSVFPFLPSIKDELVHPSKAHLFWDDVQSYIHDIPAEDPLEDGWEASVCNGASTVIDRLYQREYA